MRPKFVAVLAILVGLLALIALFNLFNSPADKRDGAPLPYSDFLNEVDRNRVAAVHLTGHSIAGHFTDNRAFSSYDPGDPTLIGRLVEKGVRVTAEEQLPAIGNILISWIPYLLAIFLPWYLIARPLRAAMMTMKGIEGALRALGRDRQGGGAPQ